MCSKLVLQIVGHSTLVLEGLLLAPARLLLRLSISWFLCTVKGAKCSSSLLAFCRDSDHFVLLFCTNGSLYRLVCSKQCLRAVGEAHIQFFFVLLWPILLTVLYHGWPLCSVFVKPNTLSLGYQSLSTCIVPVQSPTLQFQPM